MDILQRILNSNTTLIGFDTQNENSVDKILQFIPSVIYFKEVEANKVFEHFESISHHRDYKLESLLNDKSVNFVVVDISSISFSFEEGEGILNRSRNIKKFIQGLQSLLYTLSNSDSSVKFKLILLSKLYASFGILQPPTIHFVGGNAGLHASDLVLKFMGDTISIEKDRTDNRYINNIKKELREISINSLFNEITTTT